MKQTLTSSFKNSGREKSLLTNGKYYQTLNEDKTMSNVGPGMYDLSPYPSYMGRQLINPTMNDYRYRQHREADYKNEHNTVHFIDRTKRLSMNDIIGKNSSLSSTTVQRPHTTSSVTQNQQTTSPNRVSIKEKQVISERNNDIQSVRALPQYPYRGK